MANKTTLQFPTERGDTPEKWKIIRPTTLGWNDLQTNIRPIAGQKIRIRETAEVAVSRSQITSSSMFWSNRFQEEAFLGHFQVTRQSGSGFSRLITERGNMIGQAITVGEQYLWHFQREYDLDLFLQKTDKNASYLSAISNCNAYLAPAPVPNLDINFGNVDTYIRIAYGIGTGDLGTASTLIDTLTQPTIAGYTFPEEVLFRAINNIPSINLDGYEISTRLGDIELWIHPDWIINSFFEYTFEVINYNRLDPTADQFPDGTECNFNGGLDFPQ
jgi:hypothetical protein